MLSVIDRDRQPHILPNILRLEHQVREAPINITDKLLKLVIDLERRQDAEPLAWKHFTHLRRLGATK